MMYSYHFCHKGPSLLSYRTITFIVNDRHFCRIKPALHHIIIISIICDNLYHTYTTHLWGTHHLYDYQHHFYHKYPPFPWFITITPIICANLFIYDMTITFMMYESLSWYMTWPLLSWCITITFVIYDMTITFMMYDHHFHGTLQSFYCSNSITLTMSIFQFIAVWKYLSTLSTQCINGHLLFIASSRSVRKDVDL